MSKLTSKEKGLKSILQIGNIVALVQEEIRLSDSKPNQTKVLERINTLSESIWVLSLFALERLCDHTMEFSRCDGKKRDKFICPRCYKSWSTECIHGLRHAY